MNRLPILLLVVISLTVFSGCGGGASKTTDTDSSAFKGLAEKQAFLERYVTFKRTYEELEFDIAYLDGGGGAIPSPSEWDLRISAKVPAGELEAWVAALPKAADAGTDWVATIPAAPADLGGYEWFGDGGKQVGIDRAQSRVLYRAFAN